MLEKGYYMHLLTWLLLVTNYNWLAKAHDAKDFDDTILYKIDFDVPDFDKNPELKEHVRTFYTHEHEKYDCVIPNVQETKEEEIYNKGNINPLILLTPMFTKPSCSYRIEAYWSYEICHGYHVRQYHEEREGKAVKFQEYYLGIRNDEDFKKLEEEWEEKSKAGPIKYKTTKIDNINYPYFEMVLTGGTICDIINAPRTTVLRYVCYPHGKNEIYSFKETSSCNYEAIILTSALCAFLAFHPEEYKEVPIKCYNSPTEPNKPLSMLRQELSDMQLSFDDLPMAKEGNDAASTLVQKTNDDQRFVFMNRLGDDVDKLVFSLIKERGNGLIMQQEGTTGESSVVKQPPTSPVVSDISPLLEFIKGTTCLTGGSGWWKYEFCYGNYVRQFHKDKKSETELFLGHFDTQAHRQWIQMNPDKRPQEQSSSIWHHYEKGSKCDRTGLPREVDVKLTCSGLGSMNPTAVSMYLLEPKTCQYILVFESPMVCMLMGYTDEYGLIDDEKLQKVLLEKDATVTTTGSSINNNESPVPAATPVDVRL
ncbi:endoplasmic reticulum lectin 1 [Lucilia cuprina]|uniref:endoplasmic reticulum lectin 1 n=1 Tax=Lucilia cuprina TaxID=7375 RepID=UPI001F067EA1|nr:endoplasmic reticulum lectin 1 [Lucilia cuprina]